MGNSLISANAYNMNKDNSQDSCHDSKKWKAGVFYCDRKDSRVVVPKRMQGMGWSVNFGHPLKATLFIVLSLVIVLVPFFYLATRGQLTQTTAGVSLLLSIAVICLLSNFLAKI